MPLAAMIFDFDGVLANSEPLHFQSLQTVLGEHGIRISRTDYYTRYLGLDDESAFEGIWKIGGRPLDRAQLSRLVARKAEVLGGLLAGAKPVFPGAVDCVKRCAAEVPLAIASGAWRHDIESVLGRAGLLDCFAVMVAAGETPRSKPAPDPYLRAVDLLGVRAPDCVAIEDSRPGIVAAAEAGLRTIGVTHSHPAGELGEPDWTIDSLDELDVPLARGIVLAEPPARRR